MFTYNFTKQAYLDQLTIEIKSNSALSAKYSSMSALGTALSISFTSSLDSQEETDLSAIVANHTGSTTAQQLAAYLDTTVHPFVRQLINTFAAENISMGITQSGKTADVLGLFQKPYTFDKSLMHPAFSGSVMHPVSLKGSFDTGSLYVSRAILQHVRNNSDEFSGLSPFVTDARLLKMKNDIEVFLGITPLST